MLVAAAPVAVTASPPLVVSAVTAMVHAGTLLMVVIVEETSVVDAAVPSRQINPVICHDADAVPPAADWRATTRMLNVKAELLGRMTWLLFDAAELFVVRITGVALVELRFNTNNPD